MFDISVRADVKDIERKLSDVAYRQMPFATAKALTNLAKIVQAGEKKAIGSVFDRPTPFTVNSVGVKAARKDNLQAIVFVKDIAAAYLAPYEFGGTNKLNSKALLKPVNVPLNQYGNLGKNKLAQLKGRSNVFVGSITFKKNGQTVSGVWQRNPVPVGFRTRGDDRKGTKGGHSQVDGLHTTLKLLIRFADAHPVKQHLDYRKHAEALVRANFNREMGQALARAIATAH